MEEGQPKAIDYHAKSPVRPSATTFGGWITLAVGIGSEIAIAAAKIMVSTEQSQLAGENALFISELLGIAAIPLAVVYFRQKMARIGGLLGSISLVTLFLISLSHAFQQLILGF